LKKLKKFNINEGIVIPAKMDELIDKLKTEEFNSLDAINVISERYDVKFVTYNEFVNSIKEDEEMLATVPPENKPMLPFMHFAVMNKVTKLVNVVLPNNDPIGNLSRMFKQKRLETLLISILKHEDIHKNQLKRMGSSDNYIFNNPKTEVKKYLGDQTEIMAYAFSIIDELNKMENIPYEEILDLLKSDMISHRVYVDYKEYFTKGSKEFKRLRKYMFGYLENYLKQEKKSSEANIHDKININQEMKNMLTFENYFNAEPEVAPITKPTTKPGTRPQKPGPTRKIRPSVDPRPKAEVDDVINKFKETSTKKDKKLINDYYANK